MAQSAGVVEYTDYFSAEGHDSPNVCPGYDTEKFDGKATVMLEVWGMKGTPILPLLPSLLWPDVVAPDRVLSMGQIEVNCVFMLKCIIWNRTVLTFNCVLTEFYKY